MDNRHGGQLDGSIKQRNGDNCLICWVTMAWLTDVFDRMADHKDQPY